MRELCVKELSVRDCVCERIANESGANLGTVCERVELRVRELWVRVVCERVELRVRELWARDLHVKE